MTRVTCIRTTPTLDQQNHSESCTHRDPEADWKPHRDGSIFKDKICIQQINYGLTLASSPLWEGCYKLTPVTGFFEAGAGSSDSSLRRFVPPVTWVGADLVEVMGEDEVGTEGLERSRRRSSLIKVEMAASFLGTAFFVIEAEAEEVAMVEGRNAAVLPFLMGRLFFSIRDGEEGHNTAGLAILM
jgi:hypothetical protein